MSDSEAILCRRVGVTEYHKLSLWRKVAIFPWVFASLTLLLIVTAEVTFFEAIAFLRHNIVWMSLALAASVAGFFIFLVRTYMSRLKSEPSILSIIIVVACSHVVAVTSHELLTRSVAHSDEERRESNMTNESSGVVLSAQHPIRPAEAASGGRWFVLPSAMVLFVVLLALVRQGRQSLTDIRSLANTSCGAPGFDVPDGVQAVKYLVIPVSAPSHIPQFESDGGVVFMNEKPPIRVELAPIAAATWEERKQRLIEDIDQLGKAKLRCNWQQLMRSLLPHVKSLEGVRLIGSAAEEPAPPAKSGPDELSFEEQKKHGSAPYLDLACRLLQRYCKPGIVKTVEAIDKEQHNRIAVRFDNIPQLAALIRATAEHLAGEHEEEVCVDVTGGQKSTSIAAAQVTMQSRTVIQYVNTGDTQDIQLIDIRIELPPEV